MKKGWLDKFPDGGKVAPFITSDVNEYDKRKQAYDDSLNLYNAYQYQFSHPEKQDDIDKIRTKSLGLTVNKIKYGKTKGDYFNEISNNKKFKTFEEYKKADNEFNKFTTNPNWITLIDKEPYKSKFAWTNDAPVFEKTEDLKKSGAQEDANKVNYYENLKFSNPSDVRIGRYSSADIAHKKIKPIGEYWGGVGYNPVYAKPKQSIIYEPDNNFNVKQPVVNNKPSLLPRQQPQVNTHISQPTGAPMYNTINNGGDFIGYNTQYLPSQIGNYTPEQIQAVKDKGYFQEYSDGGRVDNTGRAPIQIWDKHLHPKETFINNDDTPWNVKDAIHNKRETDASVDKWINRIDNGIGVAAIAYPLLRADKAEQILAKEITSVKTPVPNYSQIPMKELPEHLKPWLTGKLEKDAPLSKEEEIWQNIKNIGKKQMGGTISSRTENNWLNKYK